ncbi:hypothetical protein SynBIOSU31_02106 [Synechococcus sp. BIOS-U3-1]|nr:hypothetical protein SynBIOSU31_02106 [Synechococcus sp. BIOS-U3-1]
MVSDNQAPQRQPLTHDCPIKGILERQPLYQGNIFEELQD